MKFTIEFGETEKHKLEYEFNQLFGKVTIKINEQLVKQGTRLINEPLLEVFEFIVGGGNQQAKIRIEKERKQLLGSRNRCYVNDRLLKVVDGI